MINKIEMNYILELLKCAITNATPAIPPEGIDWDHVFLFAKKHRICSTLYFGIQKLPPNLQQEINHFDQYLLAYKKTLVRDANRAYELELLKKAFEDKNIDYIFLKGSVTKYLYPDTSMRVMSDVDILYRGGDSETVDGIFDVSGYKLLKREPKESAYFKPINEIRIEMQTALVDEGYETWYEYLKNIWDKCHKISGTHEYKMTDEDFYLYHIIHMAKHFKHGGIGLTHILDVWVMMNAYTNLNYEYIGNELDILGLKTFDTNIRMLAKKWFGDDTRINADSDTARTLELLGNYIFKSGAFGLKSQQEINAIVERNDSKVSWIKKIFPDKNTMVDYYGSVLKKHPWLIPFYWIRLNFKRIIVDRKNIKINIQRMNNISDERIEQTKELMERCGM